MTYCMAASTPSLPILTPLKICQAFSHVHLNRGMMESGILKVGVIDSFILYIFFDVRSMQVKISNKTWRKEKKKGTLFKCLVVLALEH